MTYGQLFTAAVSETALFAAMGTESELIANVVGLAAAVILRGLYVAIFDTGDPGEYNVVRVVGPPANCRVECNTTDPEAERILEDNLSDLVGPDLPAARILARWTASSETGLRTYIEIDLGQGPRELYSVSGRFPVWRDPDDGGTMPDEYQDRINEAIAAAEDGGLWTGEDARR